MAKRKTPTARWRHKTPRWKKTIHIGQAHLAPGMNLARWQAILDQYDIPPKSWIAVPDETIDAIIEQIGAIVKRAIEKQASEQQSKENLSYERP